VGAATKCACGLMQLAKRLIKGTYMIAVSYALKLLLIMKKNVMINFLVLLVLLQVMTRDLGSLVAVI